MRALKAGAIYFGAVFAVGFCLGVLRTLALLPRLGETLAVLLELPVILTASWLICARILRSMPMRRPGAAAMGAAAFALLMIAEVAMSTLLAGRSLAAHLALYAEPPHLLGLAGQLAFASFPYLQAKRCRVLPQPRRN